MIRIGSGSETNRKVWSGSRKTFRIHNTVCCIYLMSFVDFYLPPTLICCLRLVQQVLYRCTYMQVKYSSRAAQLYREKLHQAAAQAMRLHGTKVSSPPPSLSSPTTTLAKFLRKQDGFLSCTGTECIRYLQTVKNVAGKNTRPLSLAQNLYGTVLYYPLWNRTFWVLSLTTVLFKVLYHYL